MPSHDGRTTTRVEVGDRNTEAGRDELEVETPMKGAEEESIAASSKQQVALDGQHRAIERSCPAAGCCGFGRATRTPEVAEEAACCEDLHEAEGDQCLLMWEHSHAIQATSEKYPWLLVSHPCLSS
eukprot:gnl/TRDRNA2_/TRDRNA2_132902_c0_seq2.p1 gnl/TRDRNA2_/TRDRNA2_132902_c0~~gnl/TRDRNA2_/TRDRNA2_132902_c0_seq2.p1  ORF type:complete len:126 (+),score=17.33 gnl/TRDRNA2_/TRDRNA2_132902_c0_seq2:46-423(+)